MSEKMNRRDMLRNSVLLTLTGSLALVACGKQLPSIPSLQPVVEAKRSERYPLHKAVATVFYVGEPASKDNAYIDNIATEWDANAARRFGGVDNPLARDRRGFPQNLRPKHNPFYFALPASEFTEKGRIPGAWERSPWYQTDVVEAARRGQPFPDDGSQSLFKGRWIEVTNPANDKTVYGQWLDTGPGTNPSANKDYDYVFGTAEPSKPFGELGAALDLSPAMAHHLGFNDGGLSVTWRFVDEPPALVLGYLNSRNIEPIDNYTHYE